MDEIHLVLADDQVLFVESLKRVLESLAGDIVVDAIARSGEEAVRKVEEYLPNIVLMDVRMPRMGGVEATKSIHQRFPDIQVIMLTTFDDDEYVRQAIQNGAVGYLLKDLPPQELISAVRAVRDGCFLMSPSIAKKLIDQSRGSGPKGKQRPTWLDSLSRREKEIIACIVHDLSNKEIASRLFIAEQTVKNHLSAIYTKLEVNDRYHLIEKIKESFNGEIDFHAAQNP